MSEAMTEARAQACAAAVRYAEAHVAFWDSVHALENATIEAREAAS